MLNIIRGQLAHQEGNVDHAKQFGEMQLKVFRASWPSGFYGTIKNEVVQFYVKQKHILIGGEKVFDQKLIYARAVGLVVSEPVLFVSDVLGHELLPYPAASLRKMEQWQNFRYV